MQDLQTFDVDAALNACAAGLFEQLKREEVERAWHDTPEKKRAEVLPILKAVMERCTLGADDDICAKTKEMREHVECARRSEWVIDYVVRDYVCRERKRRIYVVKCMLSDVLDEMSDYAVPQAVIDAYRAAQS